MNARTALVAAALTASRILPFICAISCLPCAESGSMPSDWIFCHSLVASRTFESSIVAGAVVLLALPWKTTAPRFNVTWAATGPSRQVTTRARRRRERGLMARRSSEAGARHARLPATR